jgi:hypothetical protein
MKKLIKKAKAIIDRYADFEDYDDYEEVEALLEDAMNIISDFISEYEDAGE